MFDGGAHAALPVFVDGRAGAAWFHKGSARVVFDFRVHNGQVTGIVFRAAPEAIAAVARRRGGEPIRSRAGSAVTSEPPQPSSP